MKFDYSLDFKNIDFRGRPDLYRIGVGEQGVLSVEPYKSEILPHWRFKNPEVARESSEKIYALFLQYKAADDFVGMDMARKFLQMGFTRARRYANHRGGRKYADEEAKARGEQLPRASVEDADKAEAALIFSEKLKLVKADAGYLEAARRHRELYGKPAARDGKNRAPKE
jgi:hypothetical protein